MCMQLDQFWVNVHVAPGLTWRDEGRSSACRQVIRTSPGCLSCLWTHLSVINTCRSGYFQMMKTWFVEELYLNGVDSSCCLCVRVCSLARQLLSFTTAVRCRCALKHGDAQSDCCVTLLLSVLISRQAAMWLLISGEMCLWLQSPFHTLHHKPALNPTTHRLSDQSD